VAGQLIVGPPKLMKSFTADGQIDLELSKKTQLETDGVSLETRREGRKDIPEPSKHPSNHSCRRAKCRRRLTKKVCRHLNYILLSLDMIYSDIKLDAASICNHGGNTPTQ
jgi:hypothetical protein